MVAAKPFLAAALIALVSTSVALGDNPTVRINNADQAMAVSALLRQKDFGAGWGGGQSKPDPIDSPNCPGFDPKESDLTVTGHADAKFLFQQGAVELDQDVQVLQTAAAVRTDFARTVSPKLGRCLGWQLKKGGNVEDVEVQKIPFPPTGVVSAAFRAVIEVRTPHGPGRVISDFVFFAKGRLEFSINVTAPYGAGDQLPMFESQLAQRLLERVK